MSCFLLWRDEKQVWRRGWGCRPTLWSVHIPPWAEFSTACAGVGGKGPYSGIYCGKQLEDRFKPMFLNLWATTALFMINTIIFNYWPLLKTFTATDVSLMLIKVLKTVKMWRVFMDFESIIFHFIQPIPQPSVYIMNHIVYITASVHWSMRTTRQKVHVLTETQTNFTQTWIYSSVINSQPFIDVPETRVFSWPSVKAWVKQMQSAECHALPPNNHLSLFKKTKKLMHQCRE